MSRGEGPWRDGRRAWERLADWYRESGATPPSGDPLAALTDVGLLRRLLDEVELEAVRSARRRGRSWAEIATKLGVTRQSAWERWRDLDAEPVVSAGGEPVATLEPVPRRGWVTVPDVVGMRFDEARKLLAERGLVGVTSDPDELPAALLGMEGAVVTDQSPESGAKVERGTPVKLWTDRGGGSGVREPRRPKPTPRTGRKFLDEPSEESVG